MTQQQRHARAVKEVTGWKATGITPDQVYRRVNAYACNPAALDYTTHLITACRVLEVCNFDRRPR